MIAPSSARMSTLILIDDDDDDHMRLIDFQAR